MASRFGIVYAQALENICLIRKFSSSGSCFTKLDIVPQLTYYNANDLRAEYWMMSKEYADRRKFLYKVKTGRLIRNCDWEMAPRYMQTVAGIKPLKEVISLVVYNLRRGRNVGHLLVDDNILPSECGDIMLRDTSLPDKSEEEGDDKNHIPFKKVHDWYFGECGHTGLLGRSVGEELTDEVLPPELLHLRDLLKDASMVDKRLISNHTAQLFREERTQQFWSLCHFLRNEAVYIKGKNRASASKVSPVSKIYSELGKLVRSGVKGIHPMIDFWLDHEQFLGEQIKLSQGAQSTPELITDLDEYNGRLLVAGITCSIEHPGGPGVARYKRKKAKLYSNKSDLDLIVPTSRYYSFDEVCEMRDFKLPLFGPTALRSFLKHNLEKEAGIPLTSKASHLRWTDISVTPTSPTQILSRPSIHFR